MRIKNKPGNHVILFPFPVSFNIYSLHTTYEKQSIIGGKVFKTVANLLKHDIMIVKTNESFA